VRVEVENASNGSVSGRSARQGPKRLKRPDTRVGVRWKGTRKQLPKALLSAAFSQVSEISRRVSVGLHAKAFGYASK
jgi:hypothetical protein